MRSKKLRSWIPGKNERDGWLQFVKKEDFMYKKREQKSKENVWNKNVLLYTTHAFERVVFLSHIFFAKLNDMIMRPYFVGRRAILLNFLQNTLIMTSCMTMIRIDFSKTFLHHIIKIMLNYCIIRFLSLLDAISNLKNMLKYQNNQQNTQTMKRMRSP